MHIINLDNICVNYVGREIFRELSWSIGDRDRVGLVGPNGAGKSTILKVIVGQVPIESGYLNRIGDITVGYLAQHVELQAGQTLWYTAACLPPALAEIEAALTKIENQLGDPAVYSDETKLTRVLDRQDKLLESYAALGGNSHTNNVREILIRLGFAEHDFDLPIDGLSGGQKKLVALARLAIEKPNVLLLDEPDNHLDLSAKHRLEQFIHAYAGAVVIVSHDRYLLDETVTQIAELDNGKLTLYHGNYSAYTTERELQRLRQQQLYVAQQKEITRIEEAIKRFEHWASIVIDERHIKQARSRRKMLDRMEANGEIIERVTERKQMGLQIAGSRGSTKALEVKNLSMGFDDDLLFVDLNFVIRHGERVGLVGPNGAGKSVLFKLILEQLQPLAGDIITGPSTRVGYYAQEHQTLDGWWDRSALELVRDVKPMSEGAAVTFLTRFMFNYEQSGLPIRSMSGGERSRLQLACLMLQNPNLLLLDEPTNNLDILSAEVLEAVLEDFEGAVLIISHDRYFLDQVVDQMIELEDGGLHHFPGGYTDYLAARVAVLS